MSTPTEWIESRSAEARKREDPYLKMSDGWEGKEIGDQRSFVFNDCRSSWSRPNCGSAACLGIIDGLFEYAKHNDFDRYGEAWIQVALTRKGREYFDSISATRGWAL